jgi:uridine kinase
MLEEIFMAEKPYVVAIAGGTCSGKSTLADRLRDRLQGTYSTMVFHMDDYFMKQCPTTIAPITGIEYVEHNHPSSMELDRFGEDFKKARHGQTDLILVEGLFALYLEEIRTHADLKVFVDLASDARMARRIPKHMQWGQTYEQVVNRYLDTVRFRHDELVEPTRWHADVVINGTLDDNKGTDILENTLRTALAGPGMGSKEE